MGIIGSAGTAAARNGDLKLLFGVVDHYPLVVFMGTALLTVALQSSTASIGLGIGLAESGLIDVNIQSESNKASGDSALLDSPSRVGEHVCVPFQRGRKSKIFQLLAPRLICSGDPTFPARNFGSASLNVRQRRKTVITVMLAKQSVELLIIGLLTSVTANDSRAGGSRQETLGVCRQGGRTLGERSWRICSRTYSASI